MGEVPTRATDLPDTVVGLAPHLLEVLEDRHHLIRRYVGLFGDRTSPVRDRGVHDLAVDVELELGHRFVADPDGFCPLVAGKVLELELRESPFPPDAVHDLHLAGVPRDGAAEPLHPRPRLVGVPREAKGREG